MSQNKRVIEILKSNINQYLTARDIAIKLIEKFPNIYHSKKENSGFSSEEELVKQIISEISARARDLSKDNPNILIQDKPRPRKICYSSDAEFLGVGVDNKDISISEFDLYPILISFLKAEMGLYCKRIDEKSLVILEVLEETNGCIQILLLWKP